MALIFKKEAVINMLASLDSSERMNAICEQIRAASKEGKSTTITDVRFTPVEQRFLTEHLGFTLLRQTVGYMIRW